MLALWFQARSTHDSVSLLTMIMNPDIAKLDRWDVLIRDSKIKCAKQRGSLWSPETVGREQVGREKRLEHQRESPLHDQ